MQEKVALYLEAGAKEVWLITEDGQVAYYNIQGKQTCSMFKTDLQGLI